MNSDFPRLVPGSSPANACTYMCCKYVDQKGCYPNTGGESKEFIAHRSQSEEMGIPSPLDTLHPRYSTFPDTLPKIPYPWIAYPPRIPYHGNQRYPTPQKGCGTRDQEGT